MGVQAPLGAAEIGEGLLAGAGLPVELGIAARGGASARGAVARPVVAARAVVAPPAELEFPTARPLRARRARVCEEKRRKDAQDCSGMASVCHHRASGVTLTRLHSGPVGRIGGCICFRWQTNLPRIELRVRNPRNLANPRPSLYAARVTMNAANIRNLEQIQEAEPARGFSVGSLLLSALACGALVVAAVFGYERSTASKPASTDPLQQLLASAAKPLSAAAVVAKDQVTFPGVLSDGRSPTTALVAVRDAAGKLVSATAAGSPGKLEGTQESHEALMRAVGNESLKRPPKRSGIC